MSILERTVASTKEPEKRTGVSVAAIVGGVVAAVVIILVLIIVIIVIMKGRKASPRKGMLHFSSINTLTNFLEIVQ